MVQIQVIGEALADIVQEQPHPGGSPYNVAVGLGRLGHEVTLYTDLGRDTLGELLTKHLLASGVSLGAGSLTENPTSTATVNVDCAGRASYEFELGWELAGGVPSTDAAVLHTGSIAGWLEPGCAQVVSALENSPATQLRSYDPNLRPSLISHRGTAVKQIEHLCSLSHVVKLSDEDGMWLYPGWDTHRILEHLLDLGPRLVVMTFGSKGAMARTAQSEIMVHCPSVKVVDTIGAGDAFTAGLLHAIVNSSLLNSLLNEQESINPQALESALTVAAACSGFTCQQSGAQPPLLSELEQALSTPGV